MKDNDTHFKESSEAKISAEVICGKDRSCCRQNAECRATFNVLNGTATFYRCNC